MGTTSNTGNKRRTTRGRGKVSGKGVGRIVARSAAKSNGHGHRVAGPDADAGTSPAPTLPAQLTLPVPSTLPTQPVIKSIVIGKRTVTLIISEVARATGLSIAHVSRVFGNKRVPSLKAARKISRYLHVSIDQLYSALNLQ